MILRITKYYGMTFLAGKGELDKFIALACCLVHAIGKLYFIWLYTNHYDKLVSIINRLTQMEYTRDELRQINKVGISILHIFNYTSLPYSLKVMVKQN